VIHLAEDTPVEPVVAALGRVMGIAYFAEARIVGRGSERRSRSALPGSLGGGRAAPFATFAVRAKRSDKSFPVRTSDIEISRWPLLARTLARGPGRDVRVKLDEPT